MKKFSMRVISLLTVLCMLFLSGCQGQGVKTETPEEFWARPHEWQTKWIDDVRGNSNEYGYYHMSDRSILTYFDYTTKQSVALCNRIGCKHDDYNCEAFISGVGPFIFFYKEKLCLITDDESGIHIYRCDLDATNREDKILLMKDEMEKGNAVGVEIVFINGDDLYYKAFYQEPADGSGEFKHPISAVRRVDLKNWIDEEICRSTESEFSLINADERGVLVFEAIDPFALAKRLDRELERGRDVFSHEEIEKMPVEVFYCDKKTRNRLSLYKSNRADTQGVGFVDGSCLYRMGHPNNASNLGIMGLEKMDMRTGESEWLWNENAGSLSTVCRFCVYNNHIYIDISKGDYENREFWTEIYSVETSERIKLPFYDECKDFIIFENECGYIVHRVIEARLPGNGKGDIADLLFIPIEEADKENPNCALVEAFGRD